MNGQGQILMDKQGHSYQLAFTNAAAITPADAGSHLYDALYVGGAGAIKVDTKDGDTVIFTAVPAGTTINLQITRVYDTDTDATSIVGLK